MEKIILEQDVKVFYKLVSTFPLGIKEAFDELIEKINHQMQGRSFYGVSYMDEQCNIIYKAAVTEAYEGEGKKLGYETLIITKGTYMTEPILNWMSKTDKIKNVFGQLMQQSYDKTYPCVEWYKSDQEMLCMVKLKEVAA